MIAGEVAQETPRPVDKVRELASKAKEAVAKRQAELEAEQEQKFSEMKDQRIKLEFEFRNLKSTRESVLEAQKEIDLIAEEDMSQELLDYKADLEYQVTRLDGQIAKVQADMGGIDADPFFKKTLEEQDAKRLEKEEADLRATTEKEIAEVTDAFTEVALSFASVGQEWLTRLGATRELNARSAAESSKCSKAEQAFNSEFANLLNEIPQPKQEEIRAESVQYRFGSEEWFNAMEEHFKPSFLPFLDKPLKALLAMRKDPRFAEALALRRSNIELSQKANAARDADIAFANGHLQAWMAEGAALRAFDWEKDGWSKLTKKDISVEQKQARATAWATLMPSLAAVEGMANSTHGDYGLQQTFQTQLKTFRNLSDRQA